MPRADVPRHRGGHDADRPRAGDQHVLAHQIKAQRRVHRIAQRIEDRADVVGNLVRQQHHVESGQLEILGKGPLFVYPDAPRRGIEVELARPALPRLLADQMPLARAALADLQPFDVAAQLHDLAGEFMAGDQPYRHGPGGPGVPVPDMDIGAADPGLVDLN